MSPTSLHVWWIAATPSPGGRPDARGAGRAGGSQCPRGARPGAWCARHAPRRHGAPVIEALGLQGETRAELIAAAHPELAAPQAPLAVTLTTDSAAGSSDSTRWPRAGGRVRMRSTAPSERQ